MPVVAIFGFWWQNVSHMSSVCVGIAAYNVCGCWYFCFDHAIVHTFGSCFSLWFISKHIIFPWSFISPAMLLSHLWAGVRYQVMVLQHFISLCWCLKEVIHFSISQHKLLAMYNHIIHKWIQLQTRSCFRAPDFVRRLTETMSSLSIFYWGHVPWW
jgi:hypothetical protein